MNNLFFSPRIIFLTSLFVITSYGSQERHESKKNNRGMELTDTAYRQLNDPAEPKSEGDDDKHCCPPGFRNNPRTGTCLWLVWAGMMAGTFYGISKIPRPTSSPTPFVPATFCLPPQAMQTNFNLTSQPWGFTADNVLSGIHAESKTPFCNCNGNATNAINAIVQNSQGLFAHDSIVCVTTVDPNTSCIPYTTASLGQPIAKSKKEVPVAHLTALEKYAQRRQTQQNNAKTPKHLFNNKGK